MMKNPEKNFQLLLTLTNRCNQRCKFCVVTEKERIHDLELDRIEMFLQRYRERIKDIQLVGGEPTLYPHFKELLDIFAKYNFENIALISNGHSLNDEQWVSYLMQSNVKQFILSFHDVDENISSEQTGCKNNFRNINNAISTILGLGGEVIINTVIAASNYTRIREISEYLYSIGIRKINFSFIIPPIHLKYDFDNLIPRYTEMYPYLEETLNYLEGKEMVYILQYIPYCVLKKFRDKRTNSNADLYCCVRYDNRAYFHSNDCTEYLSVKGEVCKLCSYNDQCHGVFKDYVTKMGWNEFKPIVA